MTTVQVWAGVDARGIASLNVMSDSRISWEDPRRSGQGQRPQYLYDQGKKIFHCRNYPHIFAYCGDSLFAALALSQLSDQIDSGIVSPRQGGQWGDVVHQALDNLFEGYPTQVLGPSVTMLHLSRSGDRMEAKFHLESYTYRNRYDSEQPRRGRWIRHAYDLADVMEGSRTSKVIEVAGSGSPHLREIQASRGLDSTARDTSRLIFANFIAWLDQANGPESPDPRSGGAPQMCRLIRIGNPRPVGLVYNRRKHFGGASIPKPTDTLEVSWHNKHFEIVDPRTRRKKARAQTHSDLKGMAPG
ncbi:hypothetical protein [Mobilicoccus caccae]|uniref:Uncharacterized protein n=1 Tax=Mobilicoccus caccae TaxID=1859295 RepID=A0ABQ6IUL5_9MICO|nr:hypothetical protein [Mobilicoccus caccae]GMA40847.1 hypothetical protein GCM10025883_28920 [Mobilicoccus caccae]